MLLANNNYLHSFGKQTYAVMKLPITQNKTLELCHLEIQTKQLKLLIVYKFPGDCLTERVL